MSTPSDHDFSEDRDSDDWNELAIELAAQQGREHDAERAYREAIASGNEMAMFNLGLLLARQPGRESEAELAYRGAYAAGSPSAWTNLGALLSQQPGREAEAEQAYREGAAAGSPSSMHNLGALLARMRGRDDEGERAYRDAIEAGDSGAWDSPVCCWPASRSVTRRPRRRFARPSRPVARGQMASGVGAVQAA